MTEHETERHGSQRRWWVVAIIAAIVIAVIIALIWVATRAPEDPEGEGPSTPAGSTQGDEPSAAGSGAPTGNSTAPAATASPGVDEVAPSPGETAPVEKPPTLEEMPFDETGTVAEALVVEVVSVEDVVAGRDIPGEIKGPAVKVVIRVRNEGPGAVDTSGASVNLTYGDDDRIPAVELTDAASSTLAPALPAGATEEAAYVFAVPLEDAGNVRIMVDILASEPDVVFAGPRP